jgi:hypothetical protein
MNTEPVSVQTPPFPTRHGRDRERAHRESAGLRRLLKGDPEPDQQAWQAIGDALSRGDEPMDRLLDWMMDQGFQSAKPLFDQAVSQGIASIPDAPRAAARLLRPC